MAKTQTLSFPIRLPDAMQAEALRLLDASAIAINEIITALWPQLDLFVADRSGPAWKQVERHLLRRSGHGNRQERCEMEQAGRLLRAQATRKQVFHTVLPLLSEGLIRPAEGKRPAKKDHREIKEQVRTLRAHMQDAGEDADAFMAMTNVLEQACNRYLQTDEFPTTYEELQSAPILSVGHLTFAGDDGMRAGQTYRARIEMSCCCDIQTRQERAGPVSISASAAPLNWGNGPGAHGAKRSPCLLQYSRIYGKKKPPRKPRPCEKSAAMMAPAWSCSISCSKYQQSTSPLSIRNVGFWGLIGA